MGDRCYMEVTCLRKDKAIFEDLGFLEGDCPDRSESVNMFEEEANYAHSGEMPQDIPYFGWHGEGGDYPSMLFACDGKTYTEVWRLQNTADCPAVRYYKSGACKTDVANAKRYYRILKRAKKLLGIKEKKR